MKGAWRGRRPFRSVVLLALLAGIAGRTPAQTPVASDSYAARGVRDAFLVRGLGARAVALGEAFTALADDASAVVWNPAGLGRLTRVSVLAGFDAVGDGGGISQLAGIVPAGPGALGIGVTAIRYGAIESYDAGGNRTGSVSPLDTAPVIGYGLPIPGRIGGHGWLGLSAEVVTESRGGSVPGLTLGGLVEVSEALDLGVAARHLSRSDGAGRLPSVVQAGAAFHPMRAVDLTAEAGYPLVDRLVSGAVGVNLSLGTALDLRAGYRARADQGLHGLTGLTAGLGLRYGALVLDYAFQPFGDLTASHRVSVGWTQASRSAPPGTPGPTATASAPPVPPATPPAAPPATPPAAPEPAPPPPVLTIAPASATMHREVEMEFVVPPSPSATTVP